MDGDTYWPNDIEPDDDIEPEGACDGKLDPDERVELNDPTDI